MGDCGGSPSNRPGPSKATSSCGSRPGSGGSTPLGSRRSASRSPQSSPELSLEFMNKLVEFMELSYEFFKGFKEDSGGPQRGSNKNLSDSWKMDQILELLSQIEAKERELSALEAEYEAMNASEGGGSAGGGAPCGTCGSGSATPPRAASPPRVATPPLNYTPPRAASSPRSASPPRAASPPCSCSPSHAASPPPRSPSPSRATSPPLSASSSRSASSMRPQSPTGPLYDTATENQIFELISLIEKKEKELAALEAEYAEMNANSGGDAGAGPSSSSHSAGPSSSRSGSPSRSRNPCGGSPSRSDTPPQPLTAPQQIYNLLDMPQRQQEPPLHHSTGINECDVSCQPDWEFSNVQAAGAGSPSRGSSIGSPPRVVSPGSPASRPASPGTPSRAGSPGTPSRAGSPGSRSRASSPRPPRQGAETFNRSPQAGPAAGNATFAQPVQKKARGGIIPHSSGRYYCNRYCQPRWDVSSLHKSYIDPPREITEYYSDFDTPEDYEYATTDDYWPTTPSVHETSANHGGSNCASGSPCGSSCQ